MNRILDSEADSRDDMFLRDVSNAPEDIHYPEVVLEIPDDTYSPRFDPIAYRLSLLGQTEEEIAKGFNVELTVLQEWRKKYPTFDFAIRRGGHEADGFVAQALYRRATGYTYWETKIVTHEGCITAERAYPHHVPPDPKAAIFWLKNRRKENWQDQQMVDMKTQTSPYETVSDADLKELLRKAGLAKPPSQLESKVVVEDKDTTMIRQENPPPSRKIFPTVPVHIHTSEDEDHDDD